MAYIFWASGVTKLPDGFLGIGKGNWETTLFLFEEEHPVPFLSTELAAYSGTFFEILCPILLVFGLGTRAAAFILLLMTAVIEFTYASYPVHQFWALLLGLTLVRGGGSLSVDYVIRQKLIGDIPKASKVSLIVSAIFAVAILIAIHLGQSS
ncbi:MAG: DoxX family protein [Rickettsiales bacterium]|nr:DoxX family protein [Rickettsiales bacterium]